VSVKKEQRITSDLISEIVNNGTTELNSDILFFLYAHLDASFTRIKNIHDIGFNPFDKGKR
jgi:hypothetical protein